MVSPDWVWGVDVAAQRLDIAFVHRDGAFQVNHVAVPGELRGAPRLAWMFRDASRLARVMAHHCPPLIVYVERPTGAHPNPALDHATGVAQAAIFDALCGFFPHPVDVQLIAVSDWKRIVGLGGNADKARIATWAAGIGYVGRQDGADALGIAAAASIECAHGEGPTHLVHHHPKGLPCAVS